MNYPMTQNIMPQLPQYPFPPQQGMQYFPQPNMGIPIANTVKETEQTTTENTTDKEKTEQKSNPEQQEIINAIKQGSE